MKTDPFLTLKLTNFSANELINWLTVPHPATVAPRAAAYLNAHTANLALRRGSTMKSTLMNMDILYPDGMSIVRAARRESIPVVERVSAADFFLRFCWAAAARGRSLALVGGPAGLSSRCAENLRATIPNLSVVFTGHGFIDNQSAGENTLMDKLLAARPDIVLLGMGSPRQEEFALRLRDSARLPTVWCVGALFEYFTPGVRPHAPLWMREAGLEWAYRLYQEPRRLAGRYMFGNAEFLWRSWIG